MLIDDLKEIEREMPEGVQTQYGYCRFCGQAATLHTITPWQQEKCDEAATEMCACVTAARYTRRKKSKERAARAIEKKFGAGAEELGQPEEVKMLLREIAEMVIEEKIDKAGVNIRDGLKATISINSKGNIKIERTVTKKKAEEV